MRPRRSSTMGLGNSFSQSQYDTQSSYRRSFPNQFVSQETLQNRGNRPQIGKSGNNSHEEGDELDERAPLIPSPTRSKTIGGPIGYGAYGSDSRSQKASSNRRDSSRSSRQSRRRTIFDKQSSAFQQDNYNVNYPPSVPGSPNLGAANRDMSFGDMLLVRDEIASSRTMPRTGDLITSIDENAVDDQCSIPSSPRLDIGFERRHTIALQAQEDVCFPVECLSEMADEDLAQREGIAYRRPGPRRRRDKWPDLSVLDEWSRFEKEGRSEERRAKRITEPQLIGGRLRPTHRGWHRAEDDAPYRFTYFNEEFQSTIHSQTISELVQPGGSFKELFIPDPPELTESDSEDTSEPLHTDASNLHHTHGLDGDSSAPTRQGSLADRPRSESRHSTIKDKNDPSENLGDRSPPEVKSAEGDHREKEKPKRYGERPTWWLDILSPTDAEMKALSKAFGIHPLTAEDIMMQEAREKVELFRNYYFVNYRTFEQDINSENFLEPVNMYVVVFREGVLSFHFSMTPHPANVRRRIRQLKDYLILSSDWISYAIIDDITDVFAPLIQNIEDEVDDIDDSILRLHSSATDDKYKPGRDSEKKSEAGGDGIYGESGGDMLRRVGDCRKKVMGLYRLLGNKADVIKGFAKRCNEHWEVAPRSEIGLYLGDIQDHIVTMTGNLSHYEKYGYSKIFSFPFIYTLSYFTVITRNLISN
jgi:magnesium transporter